MMNRLLLILLLAYLSANAMLAQTKRIDSLQHLVATHPQADTVRVNRLNALSLGAENSNPDLTVSAAQEALTLARRLGYVAGQARATLNLALHSVTRNDLPRAVTLTNQARRLYAALGNRQGQIDCLMQLAGINIGQGNYAQSITEAANALTLLEPLNNPTKKAHINCILGQTYALLGDYAKARTYARTGVRLAASANDRPGLSQAYSTLGEICRMQGLWTQARRYYEQSLPIDQTLGKPLNVAIMEGNIADVSEQEGRYREAFLYGRRVAGYYEVIGATGYLPWIYSVLARAYLHTGQPDSAIYYGTRSQLGAQQGGQLIYSRDAAEVLAQAYARRGDFDRAYRNQVQFTALNDSLIGEETIRRTAALQYNFDLTKKQSEIKLLTKNQIIATERSRNQQQLLYASVFIVGLLLIIAIVLILNNRAKHRVNALLQQQKELMETTLTEEIFQQRQQLLQSQLKAQQEELQSAQAQLRVQEERERISRDLHDHVGAQLSVIASNAYATSATLESTALIGTYAREAIQSLRDTVWAIDQSSLTLADFQAKLQQYLNRQQQQHPACSYTLDIDTSTNPELTSAQALNLFRQVQETVHNAFKYAHASQLTVSCRVNDNRLTLSVNDNGIGFDLTPPTDGHPHYGLRNLQRRASELHGECRIESIPGLGTGVTVSIPLQHTDFITTPASTHIPAGINSGSE